MRPRGQARVRGYKRTEYNGKSYHSQAEARYAMALDQDLKDGKIIHWEGQYRVKLEANGVKIATMVIDFYIIYADGHGELHEVKGYQTDYYKLKRKVFEALWLPLHPEIKYKVIEV